MTFLGFQITINSLDRKLCYFLYFFLALTFYFPKNGLSQTSKKLISEGLKNFEIENFDEAIIDFTEAIKLDEKNYEALVLRGRTHLVQGKYSLAEIDFLKAIEINGPQNDAIYFLGEILLKQNRFTEAESLFSNYLKSEKNWKIMLGLANAKFGLKKYEETYKLINQYLENYGDHYSAYEIKGRALDSLGLYSSAVFSYLKGVSLFEDENQEIFDEITVLDGLKKSLCICYIKLDQRENSIKYCNEYLIHFPNDIIVNSINLENQLLKKNYQSALNSLNILIENDSLNPNLLCKKGNLLMEMGEFNLALKCLTKSISIHDNFIARYSRAIIYEKQNLYIDEIKDLMIARKMKESKVVDSILIVAEKKKYEYFRESIAPKIEFNNPNTGNNTLFLVNKLNQEISISGRIIDSSKIVSISWNNNPANLFSDSTGFNFQFFINPKIGSENILVVEDEYLNKGTYIFRFELGEMDPPRIEIETAFARTGNRFFAENIKDSTAVFNFKVLDDNAIEKVIFRGEVLWVNKGKNYFQFERKILITNPETLTIYLCDVLGNDTTYNFYVEKVNYASNPMKRTWLVLIENGDYSNFNSLLGPSQDIESLKNSMSNYWIDEIILKKNMTKVELERFFSIELRDLLKLGKVNSLVIWYAGHGINLNEIGYWVPVDGIKDDEFTYYSISSLKGSLMNYKTLNHILVVSDACETGEDFCAPIPPKNNPSCKDWEFTKSKSAQVFTSSKLEKSSDNSLFAKSFCNTLDNNNWDCISIDKISEKVSFTVEIRSKQKPQFGRIKNLEDENGTFFFVRKPK